MSSVNETEFYIDMLDMLVLSFGERALEVAESPYPMHITKEVGNNFSRF